MRHIWSPALTTYCTASLDPEHIIQDWERYIADMAWKSSRIRQPDFVLSAKLKSWAIMLWFVRMVVNVPSGMMNWFVSLESSASLEEPGLLVNGTRQRPGDIYVPSLSHGQSYAVDVTVVSHTRAAQLSRSKLSHVKNIGCVAQSGVQVKMKKFAESCGLVFVPFALDAGGDDIGK